MSDTIGDLVQNFVGDFFDGSGHCVNGVYRADDCRPSFVTLVVTNAYGLEVRNSDEVLPYLTSQTAVVEFFTQDRVSFSQSVQTVSGDSA